MESILETKAATILEFLTGYAELAVVILLRIFQRRVDLFESTQTRAAA
jgi:hypothetical protein